MAKVFNGQTAKYTLGERVNIVFSPNEYSEHKHDCEPGTVVGVGYNSEAKQIQYDVKWVGGTNKVNEIHLSKPL